MAVQRSKVGSKQQPASKRDAPGESRTAAARRAEGGEEQEEDEEEGRAGVAAWCGLSPYPYAGCELGKAHIFFVPFGTDFFSF